MAYLIKENCHPNWEQHLPKTDDNVPSVAIVPDSYHFMVIKVFTGDYCEVSLGAGHTHTNTHTHTYTHAPETSAVSSRLLLASLYGT